jgi:hypothetical protein
MAQRLGPPWQIRKAGRGQIPSRFADHTDTQHYSRSSSSSGATATWYASQSMDRPKTTTSHPTTVQPAMPTMAEPAKMASVATRVMSLSNWIGNWCCDIRSLCLDAVPFHISIDAKSAKRIRVWASRSRISPGTAFDTAHQLRYASFRRFSEPPTCWGTLFATSRR